MTYDLLCGLYYGEGSNADLTSPAGRRLLHVQTPLEKHVADALGRGLDVVLTGNPGDGKSHVAHMLEADGALRETDVYPDLSAGPNAAAVSRWLAARKAGRRFLLLGNEGPLVEFLEEARGVPGLEASVAEVRGQLRRLLVQRAADLPPPPALVSLVDLADRSVLIPEVIEAMLERVCSADFLPPMTRAVESSVGRNLVALKVPEVRRRLARVLCAAGRRRGEHVTFRQLWAAVAYAATAAKAASTLKQELYQDSVGLGTTPLDNLVSARAKGPLVEAVRAFCDPATTPDPDLDEQIWSTGQVTGDWLAEELPAQTPPAALWGDGERGEALRTFAQMKRAVALLHARGERLVAAIERRLRLPSDAPDNPLRRLVVRGLRHLYVSPDQERVAPPWLTEGVPLWVGFSYTDRPAEERPHVAVRSLAESDFEVQRPARAPWLADVLGPALEVAWLVHAESGISLRINPEMLGALAAASESSGPMTIPEPVQRFLVRLAGWDEGEEPLEVGAHSFAVVDRPRGVIEAAGRVQESASGAARYA
ncbi:MAG TPA: hypothetical protein VFS43_01480 [Polyangiaceae bacterium]|nr:hypothetical protein [Polyangiaceae bacterium]